MGHLPKEPSELAEPLKGSLEFDAEWDRAAFEFARAATSRTAPLHIEARLERFLRAYVGAKVRRFLRRQVGSASWHSPEDVAQRVFLKLLEVPPRFETPQGAMCKLSAWVKVAVERHLHDLAEKRREVLSDPDDRPSHTETVSLGAFFVRLELASAEALLKKEYPAGLKLFHLLIAFPDATSYELSQELGISINHVDQIRFRIRRVLKRATGGES